MGFIVAVVLVALILGVSELWWRNHVGHGEFSRKFVHVTVGSFVAFWPWFLTWKQIELLSLAFLVVVGVSKYLKFFQAIHSVQRPTYGELFFAIAVGAVAFATHDRWIYMTALLFMSLADGMAAVIGVKFGQSNRYKVFGQTKSFCGTITFLVTAVIILLFYRNFSGDPIGLPFILVISVVAAAIENIGVGGLDNVLVPVVTALLLVR